MKVQNIRKGMIFEQVKGKKPLNKNAYIHKDCLYEVIDIEEKIQSGYTMRAFWLGNLTSNNAIPVEGNSLINPTEWRYHEGASVKEERVIIKKVTFMTQDPITIEQPSRDFKEKKSSKSDSPKESKKTIIHAAPKGRDVVKVKNLKDLGSAVKDHWQKDTSHESNSEQHTPNNDNHFISSGFYNSFSSCTIDDLELLCFSLHDMRDLSYTKPRPKDHLIKAMVHSQEWSTFKERKTIREIRDLKLRITETPTGLRGNPCTYETVLRRIMQACLWYGSPEESGMLRKARNKYKNSSRRRMFK